MILPPFKGKSLVAHKHKFSSDLCFLFQEARMKRIDCNGKVSNNNNDIVLQIDDMINQKYMKYMCLTCKFYKDRCTKNRVVKECATKFLKNKD